MKFNPYEYNEFRQAMQPETPREVLIAEVTAKFFAEYVLPNYMAECYEPYGLCDGEMWFIDPTTGELVDWYELWRRCEYEESHKNYNHALDEVDDLFIDFGADEDEFF